MRLLWGWPRKRHFRNPRCELSVWYVPPRMTRHWKSPNFFDTWKSMRKKASVAIVPKSWQQRELNFTPQYGRKVSIYISRETRIKCRKWEWKWNKKVKKPIAGTIKFCTFAGILASFADAYLIEALCRRVNQGVYCSGFLPYYKLIVIWDGQCNRTCLLLWLDCFGQFNFTLLQSCKKSMRKMTNKWCRSKRCF